MGRFKEMGRKLLPWQKKKPVLPRRPLSNVVLSQILSAHCNDNPDDVWMRTCTPDGPSAVWIGPRTESLDDEREGVWLAGRLVDVGLRWWVNYEADWPVDKLIRRLRDVGYI